MKKKDLFFEEAVLDDLSQNFDSLEQPLSVRAFKLIGFFAVIIIAIVVGRLFFLGWFKNDFYESRALANSGQTIIVETQRGIIFDKFNKPLVKNIPAYRLNLRLVEFFKNKEERKKTISALQNILNLQPDEVENMLANINLEKQNSITVAKKLNVEQLIKIKNLNLSTLQVDYYFERQYPNLFAFSHLIGYTGIASDFDLNKNPSLSLNDIIGKSGLEIYYDEKLKGKDGEIINYKNVKGEVIGEKLVTEPISGYNLHTTIDAEFQYYFYNRLKRGIDYLGSRGGVGIALNPQNGEVLALVNLPSFDNNEIKQSDLTNQFSPLFNRAISGVYVPGSTVKPLVAFAALKENIIKPEKEIYSAGYIEVPNPYHPDRPSRFMDWKPHGWVNLHSALARSSNVYFYKVGGGFGNQKGLGINKLREYWQKFGFGELTNIDLAGEARGFLPDRQIKEKKGEIWRLGDTYNVSIGQGDLLITPLQIINYIAGIANDGKIYQPFIVKKITSEKEEIIKEVNPKIIKDYSSDIEIIKEVQKGMIDGVKKSYGTLHLLADLPISVAGKTGTSQIGDKKINAFFVGYLPVQALTKAGASLDKQIAILILIEDAREGGINTMPIARDVLNWYYHNRISQ